MPQPPQSVQKTRARRVFGEFVSDNEDSSVSSSRKSSLCYTESDSSTVYSSSDAGKRPSTATVVKTGLPKIIDLPSRESSESAASTASVAISTSNKENYTHKHIQAQVVTAPAPVRARLAENKRRDLVKATQEKINDATVSVNETLNAARLARQLNAQQRSRQISQVRNQWKEEKEEAHAYHNQAEKMRHDLLHLQRQLSSKYQQVRVKAESDEKKGRLNSITQETEFKSQVFRDHQRALKEERDRKRRESTAARAKLRLNHREGLEKLQMLREEEDQALYQERYEAIKASHEFKKTSAQSRRQSFQFRNGDARRIRELYFTMTLENQQREHERIQLTLAAARDAEAYKKKMEEERRQSLAGRNMQGKQQRDMIQELEDQERSKQQASYELKWAGENDANAYKRQVEQERRESLAKRNMTSKEQRDFIELQRQEFLAKEQASIQLKLQGEQDADAYRRKLDEERRASLAQRNALAKKQRDYQAEIESRLLQEAHASYELKWAGEKDSEAYKRQLEKERRESLANRNKERLKHATVMEELRELAREKETESLVLKWAGENDAKAYLAQCEEERRLSLKLRNAEGKRHREFEEEKRMEALAAAHEDEVLQAQGRQDTEAYKKKCAERARASLEFRRKEANVQRLEEKRRRQQEYEIERGQSHPGRRRTLGCCRICQGLPGAKADVTGTSSERKTSTPTLGRKSGTNCPCSKNAG